MMKKSFLFSALLAAGLASGAWGDPAPDGFILKCNDTKCVGDGCKVLKQTYFGSPAPDVIEVGEERTTYSFRFDDLSVTREPNNYESNQMTFKIGLNGFENNATVENFKITLRIYGDARRINEDGTLQERKADDPSIRFAFMTGEQEREYINFLKEEKKLFKQNNITEYTKDLASYDFPEGKNKSQRYWRKPNYYDQITLSQYHYEDDPSKYVDSGSMCYNFDSTRYKAAYKALYGKNADKKMKETLRYKYSLYGLGNGVAVNGSSTGGEKQEGFWEKTGVKTYDPSNPPVKTITKCIPKTTAASDKYLKLFFQLDGTDDETVTYLPTVQPGQSKNNNYALEKFEIVVTPADAKCNDIHEHPKDLRVGSECGLRAFVIGKWDTREHSLSGLGHNWSSCELKNTNGSLGENDGVCTVGHGCRKWSYKKKCYVFGLICDTYDYECLEAGGTELYNTVTFRNGNTGDLFPISVKIYSDEQLTNLLQVVENKSSFKYNGKVNQALTTGGKKIYTHMLIPNQHDKNAKYINIIETNDSNYLNSRVNSDECTSGIRFDARPAKFAINLSDSARIYSKSQGQYIVLDKENGAAHITNNDLVASWDYNFVEGNSGNANKYLRDEEKSKVSPNSTPLIRNFVALDYNNEIIEGYEGNPTTTWEATTTEADGVSNIGKLDGTAQTPFALNINEGDGSAGLYSKYDAAIGKYFKFDEIGGTIVSLLDQNYLSYMNKNGYCIPGSHSNEGLKVKVTRGSSYYGESEYYIDVVGCDFALDRDPKNTNYETKTNTYAEYYNFKPFGVLVANALKNYTNDASYTYYANINSTDSMGAKLHTTISVIGANGKLLSLYNGGTRTAKIYNSATNKFEETKAEGYAQDATVNFDFSEAFDKIDSNNKKGIRIYPASSNTNGEIRCVSSNGATDCDSYYNSAEYANKADGNYTFSIPKEYFKGGKADVDFVINLGRGESPKNPIVIDINKTADALKTTTEVKFETSGGTNEKVEQKSETDTGDATFVYGSIQLSGNECYKGEKCEIEATVTIYCDADCKADASNGDGDDEKIKELIEKLGEKYPNRDNQYVDKEINKIADNPLTDGHTNGEKGSENSGKSVFKDTYNDDVAIAGDGIYTDVFVNLKKLIKEKPNKTKWHGYGSEGEVLGDEKDGDESKGHNTQKRITW